MLVVVWLCVDHKRLELFTIIIFAEVELDANSDRPDFLFKYYLAQDDEEAGQGVK